MKIGDDDDPFVILGNIPELSAVFETKARAPFKIVFEVCRLSELIEETVAEEKGAALSDINRMEKEEEEKKKDDSEKHETDSLNVDEASFPEEVYGQ